MVKNNKLTKKQAIDIYNSSLNYKSLAAYYGVSKITISRIKMVQTWRFANGDIQKRIRSKKVTPEIVMAIYNSNEKTRILSNIYKVSYYAIQRIKSGATFKNITNEISV